MDSLTVPGTLSSLSTIAQYVMDAASIAGLDKKTAYRLRLAVDEVATNIIVHGYEEVGQTGDVDLQAVLTDEALTISLEDTGRRFDPTQTPLPTNLDEPLETRAVGGLGVYLTLQGVDRFQYERVGDRNRNIFVVKRTAQTMN